MELPSIESEGLLQNPHGCATALFLRQRQLLTTTECRKTECCKTFEVCSTPFPSSAGQISESVLLECIQQNLLAERVRDRGEVAGIVAVLHAPAVPLPEGVITPVPAVLLEEGDAVLQVFGLTLGKWKYALEELPVEKQI